MSPRKSVQQELSRERIMDAARTLFVQEGYQNVSMRQIAKELDYSHGALYYHFKNKADLFYALVEDHFAMLDKKVDDVMLRDLDDREKLEQVLLCYLEFGLTHQSHYEIMFLIKDDEVQNFVNQGPHKTYEKFAQCVSALSGGKAAIRDIFSMYLSLHGFVTHYCRKITSYEDVRDLAVTHAKFLLKAID